MKLVLYTPKFFPLVGGLERVTMEWADALHQAGHSIWVITTTANPEADRAAYTIVRNATAGEQLEVLKNVDAVLCMNISLKALPLLLRSRKQLIISHHTLLTDGKFKFQMRQQLKLWISNHFARLNICCSAFVARSLKRTVVIHSPYDTNIFFDQQLPRPKGSILFVGRLVSDKGVQTLLQAMVMVKRKYDGPVKLTICGDGPDKEGLVAFVVAHQLQDLVTFKGNLAQSAVAELMNTHRVLVVPSTVEPFGTVVPEGLACGCTVICSNTGGLPEAAGSFAVLTPPHDAEQLALQIVEKLDRPQVAPTPQLSAHLQQLSVGHSVQQLMLAINSIRKI
ncbi:MAG TPA: glycosyltransferase family 4 protein [Phnomibacter sp.]|nr:glycosyltransferase family 4 protein [Phnomibacter sp.]